tara:strand:- start:629 stop:985 length:357 start_codon:yes stop_codon:yes gene_type:complete
LDLTIKEIEKMRIRKNLNQKETNMVKKIIKPGFILMDSTFGGKHTKDIVISWEDIPLMEKPKSKCGIYIKRTETIIADEMNYNMGIVDSITNETIETISYFSRYPSQISFEKHLVESK